MAQSINLSLVTLVAMCSFPSPSSAVDFVQVGVATSGGKSFVDIDSVRSAGPGLRKAWVYDMYKEEATLTTSPFGKYGSAVHLFQFDCRNRTSGAYHSVLYAGKFRDGEIVKSTSFKPSLATMEDVIPGTVGEAILDFVCDSKLVSSTTTPKRR